MILSLKNQLKRDFSCWTLRISHKLGEAGQAMVEFAFVAPILIGLLCGVFEFSGILFAQTLLEGGARQASRF